MCTVFGDFNTNNYANIRTYTYIYSCILIFIYKYMRLFTCTYILFVFSMNDENNLSSLIHC